MSITIKEIAAIVGVSVGTVDRALHDRGRVNSELAMKIKRVAREQSYKPNRVGRALSQVKNPVKIGVVVHLTKTPFMKQVTLGIQQAQEELEGWGAEILVREIPSLDAGRQLTVIDELLLEGINGLAVSPAEDPAIRAKISQVCTDCQIPVITFNTDIADINRMCFVGLDNLRSGHAAAGLIGALLGDSGKAAVITGYLTNQANSLRVEGFLQELQASYPKIQNMGIHLCFDDIDYAERLTVQCVESIPDLSGLLVAGGGQAGVCRGLEKLGAHQKIKVVAYDLMPETIRGLENGTIDFIIDQNAFEQGYKPVVLLFDYLFTKQTIEPQLQYTDIIIKNRFNL